MNIEALSNSIDCRSPHGERGLKCMCPIMCLCIVGRSPHGERGLKYVRRALMITFNQVALLMESVD